MRKHSFFLGLLSLLLPFSLQADDVLSKSKKSKLSDDKEWSLELGTGALFGNVRTSGLESYTLIPVELSAALTLDEVSLDGLWDGIFRGYTEFFFKGIGMTVVKGTESQIIGIGLGPRYNFVQKGWDVIPFVESTVAFGFADSQGVTDDTGRQIGLGQDFNFNFGVAGGFRYDINNEWFLRFSAVYTHFSNAGLSEPGRKNRAIDVAGPEVSIGCRF